MAGEILSIRDAATLTGLSIAQVRSLTDQGVFSSRRTSGGHRRYDRDTLEREWAVWRIGGDLPATRTSPAGAGSVAILHRSYPLEGLREDDVWRDIRAALETAALLPEKARRILAYSVTEMVNNAIDHSRGTAVMVDVTLSGTVITIRIADDGRGALITLAEGIGLSRPADALIELTKGKRTSAPDAHSGEGIFFTSKAVDAFRLDANRYRLVFDNLRDDVAFGDSDEKGTVITLTLDLATERTLVDVFAAYTDDDQGFTRSTPRIELATLDGEFISRSEAKRVSEGLDRFTRVELDFTGVELIGQGFADQLFRVWQREHPTVVLDVIGAGPGVQLMIDRVRHSSGMR